jgi:hypothetical protein
MPNRAKIFSSVDAGDFRDTTLTQQFALQKVAGPDKSDIQLRRKKPDGRGSQVQ